MNISGTVRYMYSVDGVGLKSMFKVTTDQGVTYHVVMNNQEGLNYDTDFPSSLSIIKETFFFAPSYHMYRRPNTY